MVKLHSEKLHSLYASPYIIKRIKIKRRRLAEYVARRELINANRILIGMPEWKTPLRKSRNRWEGNIKMYFRDTGVEGVAWIQLA